MSRGILAAVFVLLFAKTTTAEPVAAGTDLKPVAVTLVTCEYKGGDEAISGVIPRPGNYSYCLFSTYLLSRSPGVRYGSRSGPDASTPCRIPLITFKKLRRCFRQVGSHVFGSKRT
jgi:hypothetical protein